MTKSYHLTQEQAVALAEHYGNINWIGEMVFNKEQLHAFANAILDQVLGEPVGEVEVRKQRVLLDTFQQVTSPLQDGRHKLYVPKEQS